VLALSSGAKNVIAGSLVRATAGHLTVSGDYIIDKRSFLGVRNYDLAARAAKELFPESTVVKRYNYSSALYYRGISKRLSYTGIDVFTDTGFKDDIGFSKGGWEAFASNPDAVIIPQSVADYFGLENNEEVMISRRTRFGAFNTSILKIAGIHQTQNYFLSDLVLCHFDFLRKLDLAGEDTATNLYIYFPAASGLEEKRAMYINALSAAGFEADKPATNEEALSAITAASPIYAILDTDKDIIRLKVSTIDEVLGILSTVLNAVNTVALFVAAILLFIVAVSIFINLRMTVNERLSEIGTMRTIGLFTGGVTGLFILENVMISIVFSVAGVFAAMVLMFLAGFLTFPRTSSLAVILSGGHIVFSPGFFDILMVVFAITLFTAVFSYLPARRGGKIKPVDALSSTF